MSPPATSLQTPDIASRIHLVRGHKVILDADLAILYGVTTKRLNEQVKRNAMRFPADFMFRLSSGESEQANRSQFATGSKHRDPRFPPYAFTEHGALMAANVLNSARAIEVSVYVIRAFVRLRETMAEHKDLSRRLDALEKQTQKLALRHDALAIRSQVQLKQVFQAIRELMIQPGAPTKRPIGFVTDEAKKKGLGLRS